MSVFNVKARFFWRCLSWVVPIPTHTPTEKFEFFSNGAASSWLKTRENNNPIPIIKKFFFSIISTSLTVYFIVFHQLNTLHSQVKDHVPDGMRFYRSDGEHRVQDIFLGRPNRTPIYHTRRNIFNLHDHIYSNIKVYLTTNFIIT